MVRGSPSQELFRDANTFMLCHMAPCLYSVVFQISLWLHPAFFYDFSLEEESLDHWKFSQKECIRVPVLRGWTQRLPAWAGKGEACLDSWGNCLFNTFLCVHGQFAVCSKTLSKLDEEAGIETRLEFPSKSGKVKFQSAYITGEHVKEQDNIHQTKLEN